MASTDQPAEQTTETVETDWAILYSDGTLEEQATEEQARGELAYAHTMVREDREDREAYEGAELQSRQRRVQTSPWLPVPDKENQQ